MPVRDVLLRQPLGRRGEPGVPREPGHQGLPAPVDAGAVGLLQQRQEPEADLLGRRVGAVVARGHPGRGALVDVEVRDPLGDLGDDLDRRGAGADHRDPLAAQVVVVVPPRGVEDLSTEGVDALDVGEPWLGQPAGPGDHAVGDDVTRVGADPPHLVALVEGKVQDRDPEAEPVEHTGALGDPLEVGEDLRLRREGPRPAGVGREAEGVELAGHVARGAGVGVLAPGAAHGVALVDDQEVGEAVLVELDRGAEAREAGSDDEGAHAARERRGRLARRCRGSGPAGLAHASSLANLLNDRQ